MTIAPLSQPLLQPSWQPLPQSLAPMTQPASRSESPPLAQAVPLSEPDSAARASDRALSEGSDKAGRSFGATLLDALDAAGSSLARADAAEHAFADGRGGLQEMVLERAQADVLLSIASAAASRTAQALTTLLGMQV